MDHFLLNWEEAAQAGPEVAGGKGWNLGRLHRYGFTVPTGGVLTTVLYSRIVESPTVRPLLNRLEAIADFTGDNPQTAAALQAVRQAIRAAEPPTEFLAGLAGALDLWGLLDCPLAVRSSATAEDSPTASFAGIHASFLNITGPEAVACAVKDCFASLWTPQALAYRRRFGLASSRVACAVVICSMVGGKDGPYSAGVAFSCDPRTGRRDLVTIAATRGLGEALVGGSMNPEEISVLEGRFNFQVVEWRNPGERVLTEMQALQLARLAVRVQWALGEGQDPQDIEWAHDGEQFCLLQARPVTNLTHNTSPEVAHLPVIWSNGNLKDIIPGVETVGCWSEHGPFLRHVLYISCEVVGCSPPPGLETIRRFSGRTYLDMTTMQWAFYDAFGLRPADLNRSLGGYQPEIPVPRSRLAPALRRGRRTIRLLIAMWRNQKSLPHLMTEIVAEAERLCESEPSTLNGDQLLAFGKAFSMLASDLGQKFILVTGWVSFILDWLGQAARRICGPVEGARLASGLLAGYGNVTSAEQGYAVYDLARAAANDPSAQKYLKTAPLDPQGWKRLPAASSFRVALEGFLKEYGHRAVYEAEMSNPRWLENPGFVLEQVRLLLESNQITDPRQGAKTVRDEAERRLAQIRWPARLLLGWLGAKARVASALREKSKSELMRLLVPLRRMRLEVGQRLVEAGCLENRDDIFHLSLLDIVSYLQGEWNGQGAALLAADNAAQRERWRAEIPPPDVIIRSPDGRLAELPTSWAGVPTRAHVGTAVTEGTILRGVSASAGVVSGIARIVRHPSEGSSLKAGEILVSPSTDPGWAPLFLRATAVVMEVGGYLSHGAIVAREYGLPAVVNIPGLLTRVSDGQRITVDGDRGVVVCETF
jgi:rifampicin phosphotransferase